MKNLNLKINDKVYANIDEQDVVKPYSIELKVRTVNDNYIIAVDGDVKPSKYWIDKDTSYLFSKKPKYPILVKGERKK